MKTAKLIPMGALVLLSGIVSAAAPFGDQDDIDYADNLWQTMLDAGYAGNDGFMSRPYIGQHPHGAILDTISGKIVIGSKLHNIIVKRNYDGETISIAKVASEPAKYLQAITVMLERPGYDPEAGDWFWAKYRADGSLDTNPEGTRLAGKVTACISCHSSAPGGDMIFLRD